MIRDIVRAACVIATMAAAASLLVETRLRLAAVDVAHRQALAGTVYTAAPAPPPPADGPLLRLGRATVGWADAAIGVIR